MDPSIGTSTSSSSVIPTKAKRPGGTGRKKIAIQKIEKPEYRRVTFSKRRNGVFNRAKELAALCGAEVAVITFSQGGKVFSFANKSVDAIVDRFLSQQSNEEEDDATTNVGVSVGVGAGNNATAEQEQQIGDSKTAKIMKWLDAPISGMGLQELEQRKKTLETMIEKVRARRLKLDGSWLSL